MLRTRDGDSQKTQLVSDPHSGVLSDHPLHWTVLARDFTLINLHFADGKNRVETDLPQEVILLCHLDSRAQGALLVLSSFSRKGMNKHF